MSALSLGRDYGSYARDVAEAARGCAGRDEKIAAAVDVLWRHLFDKDVSWLGIYSIGETGDDMILKACRPKPACSPIGLHGVCGRAWRERSSQVVEDVHALGTDHIVCDPANLSEVVVPCLEADGTCWGVLDLDSASPAAFTGEDAEGLERALEAAGLTTKG